jgi:hypothetical protein
MQKSCKNHAKIMQKSCKNHAKIMQKSCKMHIKIMQKSYKNASMGKASSKKASIETASV